MTWLELVAQDNLLYDIADAMFIAYEYNALLAFAYSWLEAGQLTYDQIQHSVA